MNKKIYFDMDGTFVDFYGVEGWLECLENMDARPYREAKPLFNMNIFARYLNKLIGKGWSVNIVSWGSRGVDTNSLFFNEIKTAKENWVHKHLKSVLIDEFYIVPYGTPKYSVVNDPLSILFDDEEKNRNDWANNGGCAFDVNNINEILKGFAKNENVL